MSCWRHSIKVCSPLSYHNFAVFPWPKCKSAVDAYVSNKYNFWLVIFIGESVIFFHGIKIHMKVSFYLSLCISI